MSKELTVTTEDVESFWSNDLSVVEEASSSERKEITVAPMNGRQTASKFTTASSVVIPRDDNVISQRLLREAVRSGESFFYMWGSGKNRIVGPSVKLAQAAARCYGNAAIEMDDVQETDDSWIFTAYFIDLETGFTACRQFRQSKHWTIHGKHDPERKDDMRFQIGQSKAIRNVILNAIPDWIVQGALQEAQSGVRKKVVDHINQNGIQKTVQILFSEFEKAKVTEAMILGKLGLASREALNVEFIMNLRGDLYALKNGMDTVESIFPTKKPSDGKVVEQSKAEPKATKSSIEALFDSEESDVNQEVVDQSDAPPSPKGKETLGLSPAAQPEPE